MVRIPLRSLNLELTRGGPWEQAFAAVGDKFGKAPQHNQDIQDPTILLLAVCCKDISKILRTSASACITTCEVMSAGDTLGRIADI